MRAEEHRGKGMDGRADGRGRPRLGRGRGGSRADLRPGVACVAAVLGMALALPSEPILAGERWDPRLFPAEPSSRSCCVFGYDLVPRLGASRTPIQLGNVTSPRGLGHHSYSGRRRLHEADGILYTCSDGFLDLAHVRDSADWTAYIATRAERLLGSGETLPLSYKAGGRRMVFSSRPVPDEIEPLVLAIAQQAAYELSVWHEIITWYGYASVGPFPERVSAFSPEDLHSNLLGAAIGARALLEDLPFDEAVDRELETVLAGLDAVPPDATRAAMATVDGIWWDSRRRIPDDDLVRRRNLEWAPTPARWVLPAGLVGACDGRTGDGGGAPDPMISPPAGDPLSSYYTLEFVPDRRAMPEFPIPPEGPRPVTPDDFGWIAEGIRGQMIARYGAGADSPGLDDPPLDEGDEGGEGSPCGRADADCRKRLDEALEEFHLLKLKAVGGATLAGREMGGAGGASIDSLAVDGRGGDFRAASFGVHYEPGPGRRGLIALTTLATADVVFFCEDAETGEGYPPIVGWFRRCKEDGRWGLGGVVGGFQYDGGTGRSAIRAVEVNLVWNALGNANGLEYLSRRLLPFAGLTLDSVWPGELSGSDPKGDFSPRLHLGSLGMLRSANRRWEVRGLAGYRQDMTEGEDLAFQWGLKAYYHLLVDGTAAPSGTGAPEAIVPVGRDVWGLVTLGLEVGYSYWGEPRNSIADWVGPYASDREQRSWQWLVTLQVSPTALQF